VEGVFVTERIEGSADEIAVGRDGIMLEDDDGSMEGFFDERIAVEIDDGTVVGLRVGSGVGMPLGFTEGKIDGNADGTAEKSVVGIAVGMDGITLGENDGRIEGFFDGSLEGIVDGFDDGTAVGDLDGGFDGLWLDGDTVGEDRASTAFPFESGVSTLASIVSNAPIKWVGKVQLGGENGRHKLFLSQFPE